MALSSDTLTNPPVDPKSLEALAPPQKADGPVYVELCGLPAVGKSTLAKRLPALLPERQVILVNSRIERLGWILAQAARQQPQRIGALLRLFRHLRRERGATFKRALRRTRFVVGTGLRRDFREVEGGLLLLDEGPITHLASIGGYGPAWDDWPKLLMPPGDGVECHFFFLRAKAEDVALRLAERGDAPPRAGAPRTGKEGITLEQRVEGHRYWHDRLAAAGATCRWIDTSGRAPDDLAAEVAAFIAAGGEGADSGDARPDARASLNPSPAASALS